jgi:Methyltransferase domain
MKNTTKKILPKSVLTFFKKIISKEREPEAVFSRIYYNNKWGIDPDGKQFFSGPGSIDPNTEKYQQMLVDFINDKDIKSIFEIGCGDFRIMNTVLGKVNVNYRGADVVKGLVSHLKETHGNTKTDFVHMDAVSYDSFPDADLCIIRQVLQHLSNAQITEILDKTRKFKNVMITEHVPLNPEYKNVDKSTSDNIRLQKKKASGVFLDAPPFSIVSKELLSYRNDYNSVPAIILTSLVENNIS